MKREVNVWSAIGVLISVKDFLGIPEEVKDFDSAILININSAIETLRELGVNIDDGFEIMSDSETYGDLLGEDINFSNQIRKYICLKSRIGFDPPSSSYLVDVIKEEIQELEWRISVRASPSSRKGGENSK